MSDSRTKCRTARPASRPILQVLLIGIMCGFLSSEAAAQSATPRRAPRSPSMSTINQRFSPYLGLLRTDGGPLPNYFQFVRPATDLADTLQRQQRALQRESQQIRNVNRRIDSIEQQGSSMPTGVNAGFMRYSHFYPNLR